MNPFLPPLQTREDPVGDPSTRNGRPYHQHFRDYIRGFIEREPNMGAARIRELRDQQKFCSHQTVIRYRRLINELGHCRPCRHTGNRKLPALHGPDLLYLCMYRLVFPKAYQFEIQSFLYRMNYGNPMFRFYSPSQITRAEQSLGFTYKRGSTTARQAFLERNIRKRFKFWNLPYPFGIADIPTENIIDCDECGIRMDTANRNGGKSYVGCRVNEKGPYTRTGDKWNFLMAVCGEAGDADNPSRRWTKMWLEGGTTVERFTEFILDVLDTLPHGDEGRRYCFVMDNHNVHHDAEVAALIYAHGHLLAFRAPYYAKDGPIEYVFNTLQQELTRRLSDINTEADLLWHVGNIVFNMTNFQPYFRHCGFWR